MDITFYSFLYAGHPDKNRELLQFVNDAEAIREAKATGAHLVKTTGHGGSNLSDYGIFRSRGQTEVKTIYSPWDK